MKQHEQEERAKIQELGGTALVEGFGVIINEFFSPGPVGTLTPNPWSRLSKPEQLAITQQALMIALAQSIATTSKVVGVTRHQMLQKVAEGLKGYTLAYAEQIDKDIEDAKAAMGQGSQDKPKGP